MYSPLLLEPNFVFALYFYEFHIGTIKIIDKNHILYFYWSIENKMQSINVVNNNKKTHALLIPKNEWTRLKKILTKKDEDKAAIEMRKQLKDERHATSKAMSESWATTVLVYMNKL